MQKHLKVIIIQAQQMGDFKTRDWATYQVPQTIREKQEEMMKTYQTKLMEEELKHQKEQQ